VRNFISGLSLPYYELILRINRPRTLSSGRYLTIHRHGVGQIVYFLAVALCQSLIWSDVALSDRAGTITSCPLSNCCSAVVERI